MEVHCKRCWARAVATAEWIGDGQGRNGFRVEIRSDFEKECAARREEPDTVQSAFDCEYLMRALDEMLEANASRG